MTPDPALWYQRTPDGPWYKTGGSKHSYHVRVCDGCGQEALMKGASRFCTIACSKLKDDPSYDGKHKRVAVARGRAKNHACIDCGGPAYEWSQTHGTSGLDPEHYEPRCVPCHRQYDIDNRPRGEMHLNSKLTDAQRRGIRASVGATQQELADHFGVSRKVVHNIRKSWRSE